MSFTTIEFMFRFLPIFLIVYYVVPTRYKNMILLIGSFVFYAWGQHFYLLLLMLSIVVNYTFGRLIGERQSQKKPLLVLGLIYNFGLLVFFKYTNFFIENINALLTATHVQIPTISVVMPLGISFYTFQVVSYLVDVYRGEQRPVKNIINLGDVPASYLWANRTLQRTRTDFAPPALFCAESGIGAKDLYHRYGCKDAACKSDGNALGWDVPLWL